MKISKSSIRLGSIGILLLTFLAGTSFLNAPKETLKEIALRKQAEGKFIPVYLHPVNLMHKGVSADAGSICSAGSTASPIKDQFGTDYFVNTYFDERLPEAYFALSDNVAKQLNEGFGTTAFKAVYANDVPMKTIKFLGREDEVADWWKTEYDIVINISAAPLYITRSGGAELTTYFDFSTMLSVNTVDPGKEALGNMGMPANLGSVKSEVIKHSECFSSLDELKQNVITPDAFAPDCTTLGQAEVTKFIDRENKKYDKAMKKK